MNVISQWDRRAIATELNQNLSETFRILRRRLWIIVATVVVVMALVVAFLYLAKPRYTANAELVFDSKVPPVFDMRAMFAGETPEEAFILSEIDVIRSRSLATRVIERLHLDQNPDFNRRLRPDGEIEAMLKLLRGLWASEEPPNPGELLITDFQKSVFAKLTPRSRTVTVSFTADHPQLAADVLNTLVESYIMLRMEDGFENARRSSAWLAEQTQKARDQLGLSGQAVEHYRKQHNLFETSKETLISQQIAELNSRLTDAGIQRRGAEADLLQVRRLLNGAGVIEATPQVLQSELIRKYREEELALERRDAQASKDYGDRHPAMIALRAEKERLQDKIRLEIRKVASSIETQAQMARDRENALQASLQNVKATMAQANEALVGLRTLERQAEADKLMLDRLLAALVQTNVEEDAKSQIPNARIISSAPVPDRQSFPKVIPVLLSGLLLSIFAGVVLAFVAEHLDGGFRSAEQVEAACGLPVIAQVPRIRARRKDAAAYGLDNPRSAYAAAIYAIYTRLRLMSAKQPPKVILFTSAEPEVGKSTTSLSLARQLTLTGRRVILIEADIHRPCIAGRAEVAHAPGLTEVLSGIAPIDESIQRDSRTALDLMVAGGQPATHSGSFGIGAVLDQLRGEYDLIILDAPPVLGLADANVFAAVADATLMVLQWGRTRRQVFLFGINEITKFGGRVDGVILSKVDTRKQAYYGYGDAQAYTGKAAKAYQG